MIPIQPIRTTETQAARRIVKTASGEVFSVPADAKPVEQAAGAQAAASLASMHATGALFLQEVEDPLERKKRHAKRGQDVLASLDAIKADVLMGDVSEASLLQLKLQLETMRSEAVEGDAHLSAILDEIEVRAAVELAKRGMM